MVTSTWTTCGLPFPSLRTRDNDFTYAYACVNRRGLFITLVFPKMSSVIFVYHVIRHLAAAFQAETNWVNSRKQLKKAIRSDIYLCYLLSICW